MEFSKRYDRQSAAFAREIEACRDQSEAVERAQRCLDDLLGAFAGDEDDAATRSRAAALVRVAKAALSTGEALHTGDVRAVVEREHRAKSRLRTVMRFAPSAICAVLAVWLFLSGQTNPSFLALAAAFLSFLAAREPASAPTGQVSYEVTVRPDAHKMNRQMEYLCREIDQLLPTPSAEQAGLAYDKPLLEAAQMLMEAFLTSDGAFALKSIPQMVGALEAGGVRFSKYAVDNAGDFDLLPGLENGATIRPSVTVDDALVLRGQAMVMRP